MQTYSAVKQVLSFKLSQDHLKSGYLDEIFNKNNKVLILTDLYTRTNTVISRTFVFRRLHIMRMMVQNWLKITGMTVLLRTISAAVEDAQRHVTTPRQHFDEVLLLVASLSDCGSLRRIWTISMLPITNR